jgi:uncharacterized membrane protein YeaQ/YmgE (transglycosylase-associated protein family)
LLSFTHVLCQLCQLDILLGCHSSDVCHKPSYRSVVAIDMGTVGTLFPGSGYVGDLTTIKATRMSASDPGMTFVIVLVIGIAAGFLFDRLAGPSWLARQFSGSSRGIITSALVGIAGALIGYHTALLLALGGGLVTSVIAAAVGSAVVLLAWRMAK